MKMGKVLLTSLVMVAVLLAPACRSNRKKVPTPVVTATEVPPPMVDPPPAATATVTEVAPPTDFVNESQPPEELLPTDIDELNRVLRQRGHIRDAFFTYDEATLDADAQAALTASASWLKGAEGSGYNVLIEGHCDERGTEQYNLALGDRRANTAKDYLVTLGVDSRRIRTVSYGEERPFEEGHDEASWAQNRRAHLVLVR
ncbi:MAG TPA: peptidoglycan-associated lipoprotein Pal [Thermoanaerobaculia bacterium]|nr:peptidoglycan-associated lipoprotein Pal [Thermoanaerobaculia bacterium]